MHAQLIIDDGQRIGCRAHAAGAGGMEGRRAALLGDSEQFVVALDIRARIVLALEVGLERPRPQQTTGELHGSQQYPPVGLLGEIVRIDQRRREGIGRRARTVPRLYGRCCHDATVMPGSRSSCPCTPSM